MAPSGGGRSQILEGTNATVIKAGVVLNKFQPGPVAMMIRRIQRAGVRFAIASGDEGAESRNLPYIAGMASAFGLSKDEALKAVTLYPAQILGVADKFGSIEVGKVANLVVTDGDLLEAKTNTKYLFIDGRPVPLDSKHTQLNETFKDRP